MTNQSIVYEINNRLSGELIEEVTRLCYFRVQQLVYLSVDREVRSNVDWPINRMIHSQISAEINE